MINNQQKIPNINNATPGPMLYPRSHVMQRRLRQVRHVVSRITEEVNQGRLENQG
jgi:hypothetical protein